MSKCNNCDQPISGMFGPLCAMCKHGVTQNHQQQSLIADLRQQVERWTQMHYDEMQRHTETSVKLSTAEAQLAAEREAVRVLGAWKRADIAVKVASKQHYEGNSSVTYEALDEAMDRLVAAENGVDANPIAAAAVKENQHG